MGAEVTAALAVVSIVSGFVQAGQASKAADKQAALERQRIEELQKQRDLEVASRKDALRRETRAKTASVVNQAAAQGALFEQPGIGIQGPVEGITSAIDQSGQRETNFLEQSSQLARAADEITKQQISLDASYKKQSAIFGAIGGAFDGIGTIAKSGVFSSQPSTTGGIDLGGFDY